MSDAINIDGLGIEFDGVPLLEGLCLGIAHGEKTTLTGNSGSGKSTILRCIMGFSPVDSGRIYVNDQLLTASSIWYLRGKLAYVAQEPELGDGLVGDALIRPFSYRINRHLTYDEKEVLELFAAFLLPGSLTGKTIATLSGGEKQRVALVIALLLKRPILLLDEGASALDNTSKQAMRDYLCARNDLTILSVSHDIRDFALSGPVVNIREAHP